MAMDKYAKLELAVRTEFRSFYIDKLSSARQKPLYVPAFEIPRAGSVELFLAPKAGTTLSLIQRSDYVAAFKHTVGTMVGNLAHFHQMKERDLREALRAAKTHPDLADVKQAKVDVVKVTKRLVEDRKAGKITLALVTELPDVPQQARELEANFFPIAKLLSATLTMAIRKKKMCRAIEYYGVNVSEDPPRVTTLADGLKPLLQVSA